MWRIRWLQLWLTASLWCGHRFYEHVAWRADTPISCVVTWRTCYPSTWSLVSDQCNQAPLQVTRVPASHTDAMPFRVVGYLFDCTLRPAQEFVLRNEDLGIYEKHTVPMRNGSMQA